jgi:Zn-dependent protease
MLINVILALMIDVSFLVAIALHECSHALIASLLGDPSPRREGRQSLSLRSHLDALGTILCLILAFSPALGPTGSLLPSVVGPVGIGWGKPIKTDPWKLRGGPNGGTLLVALAGPIFSLVIGLLCAFLLRFLPLTFFTDHLLVHLPQLLTVFASVNISLALFNIIPLSPLDGYQIVYTLLPTRQAVQFAKSAPYGPFIILAIFFLLPFLAQFTGLGGLFIFQIPSTILSGALALIGLVTGQPLGTIAILYFSR